jgi:uncharacterized protein YjiK
MAFKKCIAGLLLLLAGWIVWWSLPFKPTRDVHAPCWDLKQYATAGPVISIDGIEKNLSGVTFHAPSGLLYAVTNSPRRVHLISTKGRLLRTVKLHRFDDTESIDHMHDNVFIVAEERLRYAVRFEINDDTQTINRHDSETFKLAESFKINIGIEGIAWSQRYGLFAVQEWPPRILHYPLEEHQKNHDLSALLAARLRVRDFAGLCMLPGTEECLLILSQASHSLHVVDLQGREISRLSLRTGRFGQRPLMRQPEGIAVDGEGRIYIVGEPNELLILERRSNET